MTRDYREVIDKMMDLTDTTDIEEVISALDGLASVFRQKLANQQSERSVNKFLASVEPWFDPAHPLNAART